MALTTLRRTAFFCAAVLLAAALLQPASAHWGERHHYNRGGCQGQRTDFENDDIFAPWNDPLYRDDVLAPWNSEMLRDDFWAPWNNKFDGMEETNQYLRDHGVDDPDYYWH